MSRILVLITGSIAAYKAATVLSSLKQRGHEIEVVTTPAALMFIGEATIEGLTGRKVHSALFSAGAHMAHIDLIRWADLAIVCPATAGTINKLACGVADDLLTTLFLAHDFKKPWLIAPAMNTAMYQHPITRASLEKLQALGCTVLKTESGMLACGETGEGRLLDPEAIVAAIDLANDLATSWPAGGVSVSPPLKRRLQVLVTNGGTSEPIDAVRSITNTASGRTGALIVGQLLNEGHSVHLLTSAKAERPHSTSPDFAMETYVTYRDLAAKLEAVLGSKNFDVVVHAAAVADYSLSTPLKHKIDSSDELQLTLKKNPKLIDSFRKWSLNKNVRIMAFKLTAGEELAPKLQALAAHAKPDWILANDVQKLPAWELFARENHFSEPIIRGDNREDLGRVIEATIRNQFMEGTAP